MAPIGVILMEHVKNNIYLQDKDGFIGRKNLLILRWKPWTSAGVCNLYMLNVKFWFKQWSAWKPFISQRWCSQLTVLNLWTWWYLHLQSDQRLLHIWKNSCDVRNFFRTFSIQHIPTAKNTMTDKLTHGARNLPYAIIYVDLVFPKWLTDLESVVNKKRVIIYILTILNLL